MRRGGRPGLLGTMARTAVVAGTATAVSGGVQRRGAARREQAAMASAYQEQQEQAAMQAQIDAQMRAAQAPPPPAPAAAPAAAPGGDPIAKLKELADLKAAGVLTDEEFQAMKAKIIG
jgi:hypothetical protein